MSTQENLLETGQSSPAQTLRHMILGFQVSQMIYVAAKLGIADVLKEGPKSCEEMARAVCAHPRALSRLLRVLVGLNIFAEHPDGRFHLTPLAACLQTAAPDSLRGVAIMYGEAWVWRPWGELLHAVTTGETAFEHVFGSGVYDYLAQQAEASAIFNEGMHDSTKLNAAALLAAYDFSGTGTIMDIGGGHGALIAAILQAHPTMRGMLFDLPHVIEGAREVIEAQGVANRCALVAGSHLDWVPRGGDAYLLMRVIRDADGDRAAVILQNCRRAMAPSGKLLLVDEVISPGHEPSSTTFIDINMLVMTGGLVRTEAEFRALFDAAGFRLTKIIPTQSQYSIIEGVPV
jgi:predicted O-methyltransferase YrrM